MKFSSLRRVLSAVSITSLAGTTLVACGGTTSAGLLEDIQAGTVTIGTKYDQPGLGLLEPDGKPNGLDVDVATYVVNEIADSRGHSHPEITWKESPSSQRETLIQNGEVDIIAATYSINKSRAETVNFAGPYLLTHQALLVRSDDNSISGLKDLKNNKILCSVTGSTPAQKVKEALPEVQIQEFDTYAFCIEALKQKRVDAVTTDATILNGYSYQNPGAFKLVELEKDGKPFTTEYYGIGLKKGDTEATNAINAALQKMYETGEFTRLVEQNLGTTEGISEATPGDLSFLNG